MSKRLIYLSHPYGGNQDNIKELENCIRKLYANDSIYEHFSFVSPLHCYSFMYDETEYNRGLQYCIDLLANCDMMILIGDWTNSAGCTAERTYCLLNDIPFLEVKDETELDHLIKSSFIRNELLRQTRHCLK